MNSVIFFGVLVALLLMASANGERVKRAIVADRWPTNNIPYWFDQNFTNEMVRATIRSVLGEMEKLIAAGGPNCLEFNEIDQHQEESYILFQNVSYCSCHIGYKPNQIREIDIADTCSDRVNIMHSVLTVLGFMNEQNRYDRDHYVTVNYENLQPNVGQILFKVLPQSNSYNSQRVPYDYFSVSQYPSNMYAIDSAKLTVESKFPSLTNQNKIDLANTLSPLDILQIQRFYQCEESHAPSIKGSAQIGADKLGKLELRFLAEAAATKNFSMSVAQLYLERTLDTCGLAHFWPLNYPLIDDNVEKHYTRVCVEKRSLNESCQFSIECESGECHKGKCAITNQVKRFRLGDHYAGPLKVATPSKCLSECLMDGQCEAVSFHQLNESCYLFKGGDFTAYRDNDFVSMGFLDELPKKISMIVQEGMRYVDYYKELGYFSSHLQCFEECKEDRDSCVAAAFSESDDQKCLLFKVGTHKIQKDARYNMYLIKFPN